MSSPNPPDPLSRALSDWRVHPRANPDFRPTVWQRVQSSESVTWETHGRAHLARWSVVAGLAIAVAGWAGHAAARSQLEANRERMVVSYLGELDPRVLAKLRP